MIFLLNAEFSGVSVPRFAICGWRGDSSSPGRPPSTAFFRIYRSIMTGMKRYSRKELISLLGEPLKPDERRKSVILLGDKDGVVRPAPPSAARVMTFDCYPNHKVDPERVQAVQDKIRAAAHQDPTGELYDEIREIAGMGCRAMSLADEGEPETWVLHGPCRRHKPLA